MIERKQYSQFSKFISEIGGFVKRQVQSKVERRTQPKGLEEILSNLKQVPESDRNNWTQKVFYYYIATLHDIPEEEAKRALDNLRIAGAVKERFNLKWVDPPGSARGILEYRRKQFLRTSTIHKLPPEGIALVVFLTKETDQSMKDFVKGESAKIRIARDDYIFENLSGEHPSSEVTRRSASPQKTDDDGFDPLDPKTWKRL